MLYLGTCSWKYPSWEGLLYQAHSRESYLAQYAQKLNTVEVDQWFWSLGKSSYALPDSATVNEYNNDTPDSFRFTIKAPNTLTLPLKNQWFLDPDVLYQFLERIAPLGSKIGLIFFQFGYLNKTMFETQGMFLEQLSTFLSLIPDSFPYGIEVRNPQYINEEYLKLLQRYEVTPVLASGYWNDELALILTRYRSLLPNRICLRLLGEDRRRIENLASEQWNALYEPKEAELTKLAPLITEFLAEGREVYVNVNNHYEGSAPLTITRLENLLH